MNASVLVLVIGFGQLKEDGANEPTDAGSI